MKDAYNPDTLEHISTDTPADWMLRAGVSAPAYNPDTESCYFRNGAWVIVASTALSDAQAKERLAALVHARAVREVVLNRLTGLQLNSSAVSDISAIQAARAALLNITTIPSVQAAMDGASTIAALTAEWQNIFTAISMASPGSAGAFSGLSL